MTIFIFLVILLMSKVSEKKMLLLKAAEKLFTKYGYRKVSIDEIVIAAGVAKGTFYLYFKNKDELYTQIIENYYQNEISAPVKDCVAKEKDLRKRLFIDFIAGIAYFQQRKILREIMLQNQNYFSESMNFKAIIQKNIELMKILLAENSQEIRPDFSLEQLADIYALQVSLVFQENDKEKFWKLAENIARIFIDGILSCHKWKKTLKTKTIIAEFENIYL